MPRLCRPAPLRFWEMVDVQGPRECWPWLGHLSHDGHGQFWDGTRRVPAHVFAWESANGPLPPGKQGCHSCDHAGCCNPTHIWPGTQGENVADMVRKERQARGPKQWKSKLTPENVREIRRALDAGERHWVIAARYSLTRSAVGRIKARRCWGWLN